MRTPIVIVILSCLCFLSSARSELPADQDASDTFLKAYMAFQRGEKLEKQGEVDTARAKFEEAIAILRDIRSQFPKWNPPIVRHRWRKAVDAVKRLQQGPQTLEPSSEKTDQPNLGDFLTPLEKSRHQLPSAKK